MKKLKLALAMTAISLFSLVAFTGCEPVDDYTATSNRCKAITQKGTQCKRTAAKGSIYCWQHKK